MTDHNGSKCLDYFNVNERSQTSEVCERGFEVHQYTNHWGIFHFIIRSTPSTPSVFITLHGLPKRSHRTAVDAWFAEDLETWVVETLFNMTKGPLDCGQMY